MQKQFHQWMSGFYLAQGNVLYIVGTEITQKAIPCGWTGSWFCFDTKHLGLSELTIMVFTHTHKDISIYDYIIWKWYKKRQFNLSMWYTQTNLTWTDIHKYTHIIHSMRLGVAQRWGKHKSLIPNDMRPKNVGETLESVYIQNCSMLSYMLLTWVIVAASEWDYK